MSKAKKKYSELAALKGRIREKGTSYRELAAAIGISTGHLSQKINGYYPMDTSEMEAIAEYLDIEPLEVAKFFMPTYCETQHREHKKIG
ncbi:MAG: helix-turn-helix transcriptional regulator [Firmicutes bacterium]|nr:helix-turn-helix transcriptional regulator [Bacillota bacterium]